MASSNSSTKAMLLSVMFFLTAALTISIFTYLIVEFWIPLNEFEINDKPVYTFAMFFLFGWIISLIFSLIFITAGVRAIVQRNNDDLGISRGVRGTALVMCLFFVVSIAVWYIIFQELAFFSMHA